MAASGQDSWTQNLSYCSSKVSVIGNGVGISGRWEAEEYRALGMTEEQIQIMYEFDLEQFNSNRSYYSHTQSFIPDDFDESEDDDEKLSIFEKFKDVLTISPIYTFGDVFLIMYRNWLVNWQKPWLERLELN